MLIIIAKRNDETKRFSFPVSHPDDLPTVCAHAKNQLVSGNWTVLFRMFPFTDSGRAVVYDVSEDGKWGEFEIG